VDPGAGRRRQRANVGDRPHNVRAASTMAVVASEVGRQHRVAMWLSARRSGLVAGIDIEGVAGRRRREYHHCLMPVSEDAQMPNLVFLTNSWH
jgi:hypothetical protein